MRYKRLIAVFVAATFLLALAAPAFAGDGVHHPIHDQTVRDHPWQDDNAKDGKQTSTYKPLLFVFGPWYFTVNITLPSFAKSVPTTPVTPKPVTKKIERAK